MTLTQLIAYLNTLYNSTSDVPTSGDEDYSVWTSLFNIAINVWEYEEGMLWRELYKELSAAATGDKTASTGDWSYATPTDFRFPNSAFVWIGSGVSKIAYKVIASQDKQLYENNSDNWCYFTYGASPTLEFNPNCVVASGTISYQYYKSASLMSTGSDVIEMSDPMFSVYYALNELNKDDGDSSAAGIASQKLEGMRTKNFMGSPNQADSVLSDIGYGMGSPRQVGRTFSR